MDIVGRTERNYHYERRAQFHSHDNRDSPDFLPRTMTFYRVSVIFSGNKTILRRDLSGPFLQRSNGALGPHSCRAHVDNFLRRDKP